ncbi:MAG TPA: hypothetical protein VHZ78_02160 [Rhizomicrobium sp.]|jgi:hypothetical protein|nr:hypothetical protein [Rhizomicrobium sp.]
MMKLRALLPILLVALCANTAPPQASSGPVAIEIDSDFGGLDSSTHSHILILRKDGHYEIDSKPVDDGAVAALVSAVEAPALPDIDLKNLGMDAAWRDRHKDDPPDDRLKFSEGAANQQDLYRRAFADPGRMHAVMRAFYQNYVTDTHPHVVVALTFADKSVVTADSMAQFQFMLPWTVTRDGASRETYNADIGRAVASFLPDKDANKGRAAGVDLAHDVETHFSFQIWDEWHTLGARNQAGPAIARLQTRYALVTAEISDRAYGFPLDDGNVPDESDLHAVVRRAGFPASFSDSVVLHYRNGQAEGVEDFLQQSAAHEARVLSVPWLAKYMRGHQDEFHLSYVHGASFGDVEMRGFTADMHKIGKDALVRTVRAMRDKVVLLLSGPKDFETYWLVLPDHRMILWRYASTLYPQKWHDAENKLPGRDCAGGLSMFEACVGTFVSADGVLEK